MKVDRVRKVDSNEKMEELVDDYVTTSYKIVSQGESTTQLKENGGFGTVGGHIIVLLLTGWWTFGIGNLIYGLIKYYSGERVLIKVKNT